MNVNLQGIAASAGIAIGRAYRLEAPNLSYIHTTCEHPEKEIRRLHHALDQTKHDLEFIRASTRKKLGDTYANIFSAQLLILADPELISPIEEKIIQQQAIAEVALEQTTKEIVDTFERMDNEYMQERALDIQDVTKRVMAHLLNVHFPDPNLIDEEVILIADDLTPSDTARLNRQFVKGVVTDHGGPTSHSAIIARSMNIPAVVGTREITHHAIEGSTIIVDGLNGEVIVHPLPDELASYQQKKRAYDRRQKKWTLLKDKPTQTKDGKRVSLVGNIGTPRDVQAVLDHGGEGIGLFRTEFLYMSQRELPSEEEQFTAYRSVLEQMEDKPVAIRTLDVGGDKQLNYLNMPTELNPFLGLRAIRFCLAHETIFRTQLRALLRASVYGRLKIMFPMVATLEEFRQAKGLLCDEKEALLKEGTDVAHHIEVGIMVETPSTAIMANQFAKEVDFFSIGTNDLIQYTMAADRLNERLSYLYQPYHPAILSLITNVIDAAHREGKSVSMCGEMAGDSIAIPILLGFGLDELSMDAASILPARAQIQRLSKTAIATYKNELLSMDTAEAVLQFIKENEHFR
ncbi:MAG TPA: phosphoenolpyruvate--protein phosphotransferase [Bacillota bacterium]|nr:phosphoenolpyruvate--protein phosphotransferase [Bacillota bacterium]